MIASRYSPDRYMHLTKTLFARWHHNLTLTLTLTVKIIHAVKDDTETKLHNAHSVIFKSYIPRDRVGTGFIRHL